MPGVNLFLVYKNLFTISSILYLWNEILCNIGSSVKSAFEPKLLYNKLIPYFLINLISFYYYKLHKPFFLYNIFTFCIFSTLPTKWWNCFINRLKSLIKFWRLWILYFFVCFKIFLLTKTDSSWLIGELIKVLEVKTFKLFNLLCSCNTIL